MTNESMQWNTGLAIVEEWFRSQDLSEEAHRDDNCCVDQSEVREWTILLNRRPSSLALIKTANDVRYQLFMPVMTLSQETDREALFESLLRLNASILMGCAYGLEGDDIFVIADRSIVHNEVNSLTALMANVASAADHVCAKKIPKTSTDDE